MENFTDKKRAFIESFHVPVSEELEELRRINEEAGVPLILRETEDLLSLLLERIKPKRILEIGTGYGYSSIFFATKRSDAEITTIEKSPKMAAKAEKYISEYVKDGRIEMIQGDAVDILPTLDASKPYDFVFIDASKSHYAEFFDLAEKLCAPGATVVCDNILMHGWIYDPDIEGAYRNRTSAKRMKDFLKYIKERQDLTATYSSGGDGLAVIKLSESKR